MSRILIADDEAIECRALERMIRTDFPQLEVVPSAANGLELIARAEKYDPDIAVVDINMPGMNGLDALEMIRVRNKRMKIIISTAYSEFDYARRALTLGASDYLLKPVNRDSFRETLGKVLRECGKEQERDSENAAAKAHLVEMHQVVENEFLSSLMLGEPDEKSFQLLCASRRTPDPEEKGFLGCVLVSGRCGAEGPIDRELGKELAEQMTEKLNQFCTCIGKFHKGEICFLIFSEEESLPEERRRLTELFELLKHSGEKAGWPPVSFGASSRQYAPEEMMTGLAEARVASRNQGRPGLRFYTVKEKKKRLLLPDQLQKKCVQWIREGKKEDCIRAVRQLSDQLEISADVIGEIRINVLEFMIGVSEGVMEGQDFLLKYAKGSRMNFDGLMGCENMREIEIWAEKWMQSLSLQAVRAEKKSREYVERCLIYMERHYPEDISLEQAAEASGISSFYLSRLLKQVLDQTFVQILTEIRMRRALKMVWEKRYTVKEISEQSGYGNITYFYKIFKRYTGVNIGDLREYLE